MCLTYSPSHFFRAVLICNPSPIIAFAFALIGNMLGIVINKFGAVSGNRTHVICLEGRGISHYTTTTLLAGATGLEPATSCVTGRHSNQLNYTPIGGNGGDRTFDLCLIKTLLHLLSYIPIWPPQWDSNPQTSP